MESRRSRLESEEQHSKYKEAQLLWCELYNMRDIPNKKKRKSAASIPAVSVSSEWEIGGVDAAGHHDR